MQNIYLQVVHSVQTQQAIIFYQRLSKPRKFHSDRAASIVTTLFYNICYISKRFA